MGLDMLLFFSLPIQYIHVETRHSRLSQASEQCFRKIPNYFKNSLLQEEGMFGVLRKHRSEACGRRLCLVFNSFFAVAILPKNIKTTFLVLKLLDGNCQLDFFLNNLKSTATMVTPRFRFILLKILNRLCF